MTENKFTEETFLQLFADIPGYRLEPWRKITSDQAYDLFLSFYFMVHSPNLKLDLYNLFSSPKPKSHFEPLTEPFQFYLSGEHAINLLLSSKLNSPKVFAHKSFDIVTSFTEELFSQINNSEEEKIEIPNFEDISEVLFENKKPSDNITEFFEMFGRVGGQCVEQVEKICRILSKILNKHQIFIKTSLTFLNLIFIRVLVQREKEVYTLPFSNTFWRVGVEIYNPENKTMFFWSIFNVKLDFESALSLKKTNLQHLLVKNIVSDSDLDSLETSFLGIEDHHSELRKRNVLLARTVDEFKSAKLPLLDSNALKQQLVSLFSDEGVDEFLHPNSSSAHYASLIYNRHAQFLIRRHWLIKEYWIWCEETTKNQKLGKKDMLRLEDAIEIVRDEDSQGFENHLSDQWYAEYELKENGKLIAPLEKRMELEKTWTDTFFEYFESMQNYFQEQVNEFYQSEFYLKLKEAYDRLVEQYKRGSLLKK
eukprot:snap_masked-scaffold_11-processed-gene-8.20-mRNA-1 protein AED:1.00 eAED:1.00 QI:0/0/0/0/1/1/2/0/478